MSLNLLKYGEIVPRNGGSIVERHGIFWGNATSSKIVHIPRSTCYSRCSAAMPFSQNFNFLEFVPSNGCSSFNLWAKLMKIWILKVLKSYPKHSFIKNFDLLSEKSSYLAYRVEESSHDESHITAMWAQIWLWNLDVVKKHDHKLF